MYFANQFQALYAAQNLLTNMHYKKGLEALVLTHFSLKRNYIYDKFS